MSYDIGLQDISASTLDFRAFYPKEPDMVCEAAYIGWDGEEEYIDIGDGTEPALIKVQLLRGQSYYDEAEEGKAKGTKLLSRLGGPLWHVPPKGSPCFVFFPAGFGETPGGSILLPVFPREAPDIQFKQNRTKLDVGPEQDLVIKGKSIILTTYSETDKCDYISITDNGIQLQDKDGNGVLINGGKVAIYIVDGDKKVTSSIMLSKDSVNFMAAASTLFSLTKTAVTAQSNVFKALCGIIALGTGAVLPLMSSVMAPSKSIFGS